jgi:FemAB-related protein (PEP-CTERM system-associated)
MAARVRSLDGAADAAWDRFVAECPEATFFHRAGWRRVLDRAFGHATHYLFAEEDGAITGVLPLTHLKHPVFGNALVSNAFCVYGGPAAATPEARRALEAAAIDLAARLDVDRVEFRTPGPGAGPGGAERWTPKSDLYVAFRRPIDPVVEKNMLAIPRKQRAMVRKGIKIGLTSEIDPGPERLHRVYGESVRNLGTPVFARRYFAELMREFGPDCDVLTVVHEGQAVSSVLNFYFRDQVLPYYGGGTAAARELAANDFMYWEVMRRACERGLRLFDFGRSKRGTGAFEFKKHWGFEPESLHYQFHLRRGDSVPDINPLNPKFRLFVALWKRLPLPVANLIGPQIVKHLG